MTEQQCLADKILAELPCELAVATSFKPDAKGTGLDFAVKLDKSDYPLVLEVVKKFNGDFINQKDSEAKIMGASLFLSLKILFQLLRLNKRKHRSFLNSLVQSQSSTSNTAVSAQILGCPAAANLIPPHRVLCLEVMRIQVLQMFNVNLEKLGKVAVSQPVQASAPAVAAPPSQKVERSTRPTEGHKEGDVVWIYAENQGGERYESA